MKILTSTVKTFLFLAFTLVRNCQLLNTLHIFELILIGTVFLLENSNWSKNVTVNLNFPFLHSISIRTSFKLLVFYWLNSSPPAFTRTRFFSQPVSDWKNVLQGSGQTLANISAVTITWFPIDMEEYYLPQRLIIRWGSQFRLKVRTKKD